jgi:CRISPR-associated protein Cmr6
MGEKFCSGLCGVEMMKVKEDSQGGRPLYKAVRGEDLKLTQDAHTGLWYERFFNQYQYDKEEKSGWQVSAQDKQNWIQTVTTKKCGDDNVLKQSYNRMTTLISKLEGDCEVYATDWYFVTGLGLSHPVENGFSWHPTLGVPYLQGSAVKGLLRAWIENWAEDLEKDRQPLWQKWFGMDKQQDGKEAAGDLIFFDALPIEPVELTLDVMAPHMGKWYEEGGEISEQLKPDRVPADWHNPVPVPFLAVKKGSFIFALASRSRTVENVKKALAELGKALEVLGAGAKTAVGYGRFRMDEEERRRLEEEKAQQEKMKQDEQRVIEEAKLSPEEKALRNLQQAFKKAKESGNEKPGGELSELLSNTMKQAESLNWSARDKTTLADIAEAIYKLIGWGSGAKKQEKRDKISRLRG